MSPIDQITAYLDGKTPLKAFYDAAMTDKDLQACLEQDVAIPPYTNDGNLLLYIMNQDPSVAATDINIRDALSQLLNVLGIDHAVDRTSLARYELILDATPAWLSLPEDYITRLLGKIPDTLGRAARLKAAKTEIAADFRYLKKPPKWLQSPAWIFAGTDRPMIFVGQLDLADLLHDDAQVYVFFDDHDHSVHTVQQAA